MLLYLLNMFILFAEAELEQARANRVNFVAVAPSSAHLFDNLISSLITIVISWLVNLRIICSLIKHSPVVLNSVHTSISLLKDTHGMILIVSVARFQMLLACTCLI